MVHSHSCFGKIIIIWLIVLLPVIVSGAFNELGMGGYPLSLGEAFVSIPGNGNSIYYNPAGLGYLKNIEFGDSFQLLYPGLENDNIYYNSLYFTYYREKIGGFGIAWKGLFSNLYNENTIYLAYGSKIINTKFGDISMGITPKLLLKSHAENEYTRVDNFFNKYGYSKKAFALDIGLLCKVSSDIFIGASAANLNSPDIGLSTKTSIPCLFRLGGSWRKAYPFTIKSKWISNLLISSDIVISKDLFKFLIGSDMEIYNLMSFILGFNIGNNDYKKLTSGLQYKVKIKKILLKINYAFIFGLNEVSKGTYGNHIISLRFEI